MANSYSIIKGHEPIRIPDGWDVQEKKVILQLEEIFDDIYRRFGRLDMKDFAPEVRQVLEDGLGGWSEVRQKVDEIDITVQTIEGNYATTQWTSQQISSTVSNYYGKVTGLDIDVDGVTISQNTGASYGQWNFSNQGMRFTKNDDYGMNSMLIMDVDDYDDHVLTWLGGMLFDQTWQSFGYGYSTLILRASEREGGRVDKYDVVLDAADGGQIYPRISNNASSIAGLTFRLGKATNVWDEIYTGLVSGGSTSKTLKFMPDRAGGTESLNLTITDSQLRTIDLSPSGSAYLGTVKPFITVKANSADAAWLRGFGTEGFSAGAVRVDPNPTYDVAANSGQFMGFTFQTEGSSKTAAVSYILPARNYAANKVWLGYTNLSGIGNWFDYCAIDQIYTKNSVTNLSSRQVKDNIQEIDECGDKLDKLKPVSFVYKDHADREQYGLVYEDTVDVMPEICSKPDEMKGIQYTALIPFLLKEIQNLRRHVAALEGG